MILRARIVLPITSAPLENGAIQVSGSQITWVGPWTQAPPDSEIVDLGESILLPGLINAHCHLDYTEFAGKVPPPKSFTDWIRSLVALKTTTSLEDYRRSWAAGAEMLLQTGTTTVANVEAVPELLPEAWTRTPLRVLSFREIISLRSTPQEAVSSAVKQMADLPEGTGRVGLSPHAPYTTSAEVLGLSAEAARRHGWGLTTHVAESEEEFEMFAYRHGPLYRWLEAQRDMSDCGLGTPVEHLYRAGYLGDNLLAVHVNYLGRHDAGRLGSHDVSVVHCPRSSDYFGHLPFPRQELEGAGVNVCLGTDSLATVRVRQKETAQLSMFDEMRAFHTRWPDVEPEKIVEMCTSKAAAALWRDGVIGEFREDALADGIAIPYRGPMDEAFEAVVNHRGSVSASVVGGKWARRNDQ